MLHLDMDAFFASVEQLTRPTLRGRPVLVGGLGGRGVVAGASYEARVFGARSAMPMHQARRLIGVAAVVLPPRGVVYGVASRRVFDAVRGVVPVVEQLSFDEAFGETAELAGASAAGRRGVLRGAAATGARRDGADRLGRRGLGQADRQDRLRSGQTRRRPGGFARRGSRAARRACRCGGCGGSVRSPRRSCIGSASRPSVQLAALTDAEAANILGATVGPALHRLARGIDDRPVAERAEAKQISAESTFAVDLTTLEQLREAIGPIAEHAHQRLLRDGRGARTVTVKLKKSDMSTLTRSATLPYATTEAAALIARWPAGCCSIRARSGRFAFSALGFSGLSRRASGVAVPGSGAVGARDRSDAPTRHSRDRGHVRAGARTSPWRVGDDVTHREFGHGWVQGAGHGVVTVRFETRGIGPGSGADVSRRHRRRRQRQSDRQPGLAGFRGRARPRIGRDVSPTGR